MKSTTYQNITSINSAGKYLLVSTSTAKQKIWLLLHVKCRPIFMHIVHSELVFWKS